MRAARPLVAAGVVAGAVTGVILGLLLPAQGGTAQEADAATRLQAVESIPEARLVEIRRDPEAPAFGEVFDLHLTLRLGPGLVAFLPDTLIPTEAVESWGPGSWRGEQVPGDSVDIHATYPVIGYREALVEYPWIELRFLPVEPGGAEEAPLRRIAEMPAAVREETIGRLLRLGGVELGAFPPTADGGLGVPPRPPADVLGGDRSLWSLLGAFLLGFAALAGAALAVRSGWRKRTAAHLARSGRGTPRQRALLELDRIHELEWHRNGRVDEFYASSSNALRRFAGEIEPDWGPELTSRELLARLRERWGAERAASLTPSVEAAERVKFGAHRPAPDTAEADWRAIRDWIEGAPDG